MKKEGRLEELQTPTIATVPKRFEVENRLELNEFPVNVLFGTFTSQDGLLVIATAEYQPDLETYRVIGTSKRLLYYNTLDSSMSSVVRITRKINGWEGKKIINGKQTRLSVGREWKDFFTQFTIGGLSFNEPCSFEPIPFK
jgi:hypothetical protein